MFCTNYPLRVLGELEQISADIRREAGYTRISVPTYHTIYTHIHTYGQFRFSNHLISILQIFGLWEEAWVPRENPHRHR